MTDEEYTLAKKENIIGMLDWEISQLDKDIESMMMEESMYDDIPTRLQFFNRQNKLLKNRATLNRLPLPFGLEDEKRTIQNYGITTLNNKYIETIQRFKAMQDELDAMKSKYRHALMSYRNWIRDYTLEEKL